jgi:CheY-like chemotaxis protein
MSHEIRTPMNGVIAAADLALDEELSTKVKKYINIIKSSGNNLLSIINDILDLSKIEAGKLELAPFQFNFCEMMESITNIFIATIREKDIELVYDIDPDLPEQLFGDKTRIKQILTNLIGNSFKFTGKNGLIKLTVSFTDVDSENLMLNFSVYDNGIGISKIQQKKLFKAFSQADISTTREYGGSGLGLALSKQLTELMDGSISVTSVPDKETFFDFTLKLKKIDVSGTEDLERYKSMKALVADSNNENSNILVKHLKSIGFQTDKASSCQETLEIDLFELNSYDLIFVERDMGKLNNINITNILKKTLKISPAVIPIVSLNNSDKLLNNDMDDYKIKLQRPFHKESLLKVIHKCFEDLSDLKVEKTMHIKSYKSLLTDLKLLIVEDNPVNQKIAIAILKKVGIKTYVAENGVKAIDILKRKVFDLVLMDIQMPKMDGYTATKVIREELKLKDLPIIAMTAHALKGDREKCFESGMDEYISKPIDRTLLYEILLKAIQQ